MKKCFYLFSFFLGSLFSGVNNDVLLFKNALYSDLHQISPYNPDFLTIKERLFINKVKNMFPKPFLCSEKGRYHLSTDRKRLEEHSMGSSLKLVNANVWPYKSGVILKNKEIIEAAGGYQILPNDECSNVVFLTKTFKEDGRAAKASIYLYEIGKPILQAQQTSLIKTLYKSKIPETAGLIAISQDSNVIAFADWMKDAIMLYCRKSKNIVRIDLPFSLTSEFFLQLNEDGSLFAACGKENENRVIYFYTLSQRLLEKEKKR